MILIGVEAVPERPQFYLNGKLETPTVQELGGVGARPLRRLVQQNNKTHNDELIQVYAMGTRDGDDLRIEMGLPLPGTRVTLYKLFREPKGPRYFTMPISVYHGEANVATYQEKIVPYRSEYLIIAFEKTDTPNKKSANLLYFEERVRNLRVLSMKPNLTLSSLKLKMKDISSNEESFTFDAQELIERFIRPQRIFVIRLWNDERCCSEKKVSS